MLHKRSAALILAVSLPALGGCVQATRHSNTMVFGTNTSLAARIGQSVAQVPEVSVGYSRQEAVIMPLLANTGDSGGQQGKLSPCGVPFPTDQEPAPPGGRSPTTTLPKSDAQPHPCKFVATKTSLGGISFQDSYSVLASFGATIKARSPRSGTESGEIGVGLAQYFATGVAAQLLAANGGAAVVSVSEGAKESAKSAKTGAATAAVTGTGADAVAAAILADTSFTADPTIAEQFTFMHEAVATRIEQTNDDNLIGRLRDFDASLKGSTDYNPGLSGLCIAAPNNTAELCAKRIRRFRPLSTKELQGKKAEVLDAISTWSVP